VSAMRTKPKRVRDSIRLAAVRACTAALTAAGLAAGGEVVVLNACTDTAGARMTWGQGVDDSALTLVREDGQARGLRISGRMKSGRGRVYLGVRLPVPRTDLRNRRLYVSLASPTPKTTEAVYVRLYNADGKRSGSWVNWGRPFGRSSRIRIQLHPAHSSTGFRFEPKMVRASPEGVASVEVIAGCRTPAAVFALDVLDVACDPQPLVSAEGIRSPKKLFPSTPVGSPGKPACTVFVPAGEVYREVAQGLVNGVLRRTGIGLPVKTSAMAWRPDPPASHAIVLGNANNNGLVALLYSLGYCAADAVYPGRGGYVVRTIHDPWGTGRNVILLGVCDPQGAGRAVEEFLRVLPANQSPVVPRVFRLHPGEELAEHFKWLTRKLPDDYAVRQVEAGRRALARGRHTGVFGMIAGMGERYLWTGFEGYARAFVDLLFLAEEFRGSNPSMYGGPWGMDSDFMAYRVFRGWDNVEECPLITAEERLRATHILACWMREAVAPKARVDPGTPRVRHNHLTFPALGCWVAGRYMALYYPNAVEGQAWLELARACFDPQIRAAKPMEDCNGYQWLTLGHTIEYALAARDATFFTSGCAARTADYAIITMDNFGYQTPYGDTGSFKCWFSELPLLRKAAWYYHTFGAPEERRKAQEYQWALEKKSQVVDVVRLNEYAADISARPPARLLGARAWPVEALYYQTFPAPNAPPVERCVDKIVMRAGFGRDDAYLLLDGLNNGGHKHYDGNTISRITALGRIWLADNDYYKAQPVFHNGVLVFREGQGGAPPPYCELVRCDDLPDAGFSQTTLHDYAGADWRRSIFWKKSSGIFIVTDDLTARSDGQYMFHAKWHGIGAVRTTERGLVLEQEGVRFRIQPGMDAIWEVEDDPDLGSNWRGYPYADPVVRTFTEIVRSRLRAGQSARIVNLLGAFDPDAGDIGIRRLPEEDVYVVEDTRGCGILAVARPAPGKADLAQALSNGAVTWTGVAAYLAADRMVGIGLTRFTVGGFRAEADAPVSFDLSLGGAGVLVCDVRTKVRLAGEGVHRIRIQSGSSASNGERGETVYDLAPGRHVVSIESFPMEFLESLVEEANKNAVLAKRLPPYRPHPTGRVRWVPQWTWTPPTAEYLLTGNRGNPKSVDAGVQIHVEPAPRKTNVFGDTPNSAAAITDGGLRDSRTSTQWDPDLPVMVRFDFPAPVTLSKIVLYLWYAEHSSKNRKFGISAVDAEAGNDGFVDDVRHVGRVVDVERHPDWGRPKYGPVKYEIPCPERLSARQLRLRFTPRPGFAVYIAEIEVWGRAAHARPVKGQSTLPRFPVRCMATAQMSDGKWRVVCGADDGRVVLLDDGGRRIWQRKLTKRVCAALAADLDADGVPEFVVGGEDEYVRCYDVGGRELWNAHPDSYKSPPVVRVLLSPIRDDAGRRLVVAGADNWRYTAYDWTGKRLWFYESVHRSTAGATPDLDGDGRQEVFCGTNYYWWAAVRSTDGRRLWSYTSRTGPGCNAAAAGDIDGDGNDEVVVGGKDGNLHALDNDGRRLWLYNMGDEVRAVLCTDLDGDDTSEVVACGDGFDVLAVDGRGRRLWRLDTGRPVSALCEVRGKVPRFLFANKDGRLGVVDANGRLLGIYDAGQPVRAMAVGHSATADGTVIVALDDGRVKCFDLHF